MKWSYTFQPRLLADLKPLDHQEARRILEKLEAIQDAPLRTMKRLRGSDLFSLRFGDYRACARAFVAQHLLEFVRAGNRRNIHER